MQKTEQLYEGKAKKVWATDDPEIVIPFSANFYIISLAVVSPIHLNCNKSSLLFILSTNCSTVCISFLANTIYDLCDKFKLFISSPIFSLVFTPL